MRGIIFSCIGIILDIAIIVLIVRSMKRKEDE